MAQTLFKATGITESNIQALKDTASAVTDVKWVNINSDNIVVTHGDAFDERGFIVAVQSVDSSVSLTKG